MNFKRWTAALLAAVALAACGQPTVQTVARVDNVILSRQELDERIERRQSAMGEQPGIAPLSPLDMEQQMVDLFVQQQLTLAVARQRGVAVSDQEIDRQIGDFRTNIAASGGTIEDAVESQLGFPSVESTEFRQFVTYIVAQQKLGETLVTTDTVRQQVTEQVMAETKRMVEKADVQHILVETEDEAKQVIERLDAGEAFEDLAKELSTDPGSKDNGGKYEGIQRGQFVPEFEQAMFEDLEPGETTQTPVQTQFGYHVIRLISRTEGPALSEEEATLLIEQQIGQQLAQERQLAVSELLDQERTKAEAEGRIEVPDYPEPTPLPTAVPEPETAPTAQP